MGRRGRSGRCGARLGPQMSADRRIGQHALGNEIGDHAGARVIEMKRVAFGKPLATAVHRRSDVDESGAFAGRNPGGRFGGALFELQQQIA